MPAGVPEGTLAAIRRRADVGKGGLQPFQLAQEAGGPAVQPPLCQAGEEVVPSRPVLPGEGEEAGLVPAAALGEERGLAGRAREGEVEEGLCPLGGGGGGLVGDLVLQDMGVVQLAQEILEGLQVLDGRRDTGDDLPLERFEEIAQALGGDPRPVRLALVARLPDAREMILKLPDLGVENPGGGRAQGGGRGAPRLRCTSVW